MRSALESFWRVFFGIGFYFMSMAILHVRHHGDLVLLWLAAITLFVMSAYSIIKGLRQYWKE